MLVLAVFLGGGLASIGVSLSLFSSEKPTPVLPYGLTGSSVTPLALIFNTPSATSTPWATATPSVTPPPSATLTPSVIPTATPDLVEGVGLVAKGGNLRRAPQVASATVLGLIWPGDQVTFIEQRRISGHLWYRIRIMLAGPGRTGAGVPAGTEGWASATLLTPPGNTVPTLTPMPTQVVTMPEQILPTTKPTPLPTAVMQSCVISVDGRFGTIWHSRSDLQRRIGCPTQAGRGGQIAEQPYQRGSMFYYDPLRMIYAIAGVERGTWRMYEQDRLMTQPTPTPSTPPPGLIAPIRGFGLVWSTQTWVRNTLGWGTRYENGPFDGMWQPFEHGTMLFSPVGMGRGRTLYVLFSDGTFERYNAPNP